MKHNPRLNEEMARLPGFADIHPLQPQSTVQGALELIGELARWLMEMTGMPAVAMSPKAGAHGEVCGMMAIKAAIAARGEGATRKIVLVPESAHGTNPATAACIGFEVRPIPAKADGAVDLEALKARLGPDVAAIMLTNPNTCGLFERESSRSPRRCMRRAPISIATAPISTPSSARRGRAISASTPCTSICTRPSRRRMAAAARARGRSCCRRGSRPLRRSRFCARTRRGFSLVEHASEEPQLFGRITAFHGQMGMFVRALAYMLSHGARRPAAGVGRRGARTPITFAPASPI